MSHSIRIWNRREAREEIEQVYGETLLQWAYGTFFGRKTVDHLLSRNFISYIYGIYQSSFLSRHKIAHFIRDFSIPMGDYEESDFHSFNEFFIRRFKPRTRQFVASAQEMPAFCEGRYFAFEKIRDDQKFPIKGLRFSVEELLGNSEKARPFREGPLLLARLCPTDYHRFHFPDSGKVLENYRVGGVLHSVNPLALKYRGDIFITNERQVSILKTQNFGLLAFVEVGALFVGKIVQTFTGHRFARGDEKGYFLFGASTVIVIGENGAWKPDEDLLNQTDRGCETLVRLGDRIASTLRDS